MKTTLITIVLFLVLPWKLNGDTAISPSNPSQHEGTSKDDGTSMRGDKTTIFSPKNQELPLKINGDTTLSPSSTGQHEGSSKDHETSIRMSDKTPIFSQKKQDEYTTESRSENVSSSRLSSQTSSHLSSLSLSRGWTQNSFQTNQTPITPIPQNMRSEKDITTRDRHQTSHHLKSTNKHLPDKTTQKRITRSAEKSLRPQTNIFSQFQTTPEVITNESGVVSLTEVQTTKWSSLPQEKESTGLPILQITELNGTFDMNNEQSNGTVFTISSFTKEATDPLSTSLTTTGFSSGHFPTGNTQIATTGTTVTMDRTATETITTKDMTTDRKGPTPNHETTHAIQPDNTQTTKPKSPNKPGGKEKKKEKNKEHPGIIVATVIGSILFLMLGAIVVVLVRKHQMKKKQMENPDWAGPSPFIEGNNLSNVGEDGSFHRQESKRISLHSFLPQRLSKRFSLLRQTDEEVILGDIPASSTFGRNEQCNVQPLNENATADQIQTHETNSQCPAAEASSASTVPEMLNTPSAPDNNVNMQPSPKPDHEITPSPPREINIDVPPQKPFEDVDLDLSPKRNTDSTLPSDVVHIPPPQSAQVH